VIDGVESEGWRFVAFVRLMPLFPFNLLNYALGLTRIPLAQFVIASFVFMAPGALAYTYLGYVGREALAGGEGLVQKSLLALALLAAVAFVPRFLRRARAAPARLLAAELKRRLAKGEDITVLDVRSATDYSGELGHVEGSVNIPLDQLPRRLSELERVRERPIAVICRTHRMSSQAVDVLRRAGFRRVQLVADGMLAWRRHADA
jgi:rhodanese-related sulfurtransferase